MPTRPALPGILGARMPLSSTLHECQMGAPGPLFLCNLSCMPLMKLAAEKVPLAIASRWLRLSQGGLQGSRANTNGTSQSAGKPRVHHASQQPQDHASAQACTHVTRMCKRTQPARLYHWHSSMCRCHFSYLHIGCAPHTSHTSLTRLAHFALSQVVLP